MEVWGEGRKLCEAVGGVGVAVQVLMVSLPPVPLEQLGLGSLSSFTRVTDDGDLFWVTSGLCLVCLGTTQGHCEH